MRSMPLAALIRDIIFAIKQRKAELLTVKAEFIRTEEAHDPFRHDPINWGSPPRRLVFRTERGEEVGFDVGEKTLEWLSEGDSGLLTYKGGLLVTFEKDADKRKVDKYKYLGE